LSFLLEAGSLTKKEARPLMLYPKLYEVFIFV
jgi:hypothetical protein